jgi:hypothetical protein
LALSQQEAIMAVVNAKAPGVANADAAVQTLSPNATTEGAVRKSVGSISKAASDNDGSTYRIARVHSSWRILSIMLYNDAFAAAAGWTVGLYRTAADGGAAVVGTAYTGALAPTAANQAGQEVGFGTGRLGSKIGQQVWQDANLTADPNLWYDIVVVAATAGAAAGSLSWAIEYVK